MRRLIFIAGVLGVAGVVCMTGCGKRLTGDATDKEKEFIVTSWADNYADLEEMAQASDMIALIKVESSSVDDSGAIEFTNYTVEVTEGIYQVETGEHITIQMIGYETEDVIYEIEDDPLMHVGEEYLVFCLYHSDEDLYSTLTGSQGRLAYEDGKINSLNVVNEQVKASSNSLFTVEDADAEELIAEIKSYMANDAAYATPESVMLLDKGEVGQEGKSQYLLSEFLKQ